MLVAIPKFEEADSAQPGCWGWGGQRFVNTSRRER